MSRMEQLPPEQQAVLSLLVRQGRSYAQVAELLGLDATAVRRRALEAVDGLGGASPEGLDDPAADQVADYLLGQSDTSERIQTLDLLMSSAPARAWARRVARALGTIATVALPAVPDEPESAPSAPATSPPPRAATPPPRAPAPSPSAPAPPRRRSRRVAQEAPAAAPSAPTSAPEVPAPAVAAEEPAGRESRRERTRPPRPPRSRRPREPGTSVSNRGAGVLLISAIVVIAAIVVFVLDVGSPSPAKGPIPASAATASTSTTAGSSASADVLGEVKLSPASKTSNASGEVALIKNGSNVDLAFSATHLPSPGTGRYVLVLFNSKSSSTEKALGTVSASSINSSGSVGPLEVTLPSNASDYNVIGLVLQGGSSSTNDQFVLYGTSSSGF